MVNPPTASCTGIGMWFDGSCVWLTPMATRVRQGTQVWVVLHSKCASYEMYREAIRHYHKLSGAHETFFHDDN